MSVLTLDMQCPHCLRERAVLTGIGENRKSNEQICSTIFLCRSCENLVVADIDYSYYGLPIFSSVSKSGKNTVISSADTDYRIVKIYPKPDIYSAPDNTPPRAEKFFLEATEDFQRGRYETCSVNCRKVLDIATQNMAIEADVKSGKLYDRINKLKDLGLITPEIADWGHIIRKFSNDSVHTDVEVTENEAQELLSFVEIFLIYTFTLPAMVADNKLSN
ncbi:DUF4145 domain-containing protein [Xenorhabdus bovienii]|uniref:DUF4145 domain-containing protein n=1 Tax=Xenorhabdus bovienii TaxID=40576 RepID=UPI00237C70D2|nr:DUF4145 domain-containing protein [Xenorhabdus bovienii]MDE1493123.1 DUF4145 domain-containing protein [Xenorhabdus bovienii]